MKVLAETVQKLWPMLFFPYIRSQVKIFCMSGKSFSQKKKQKTYMPNKKGPSETVLKLLGQGQFFFKVGHRSFFFLHEWEVLVSRNLHAKY